MRDDDVRALLQAEAESAPRPAGLRSRTVRQARLRRAAILATSIATVVAVAVSGVLVARAFNDERQQISPALEIPDGLIAFTTQGPDDMTPWIAVAPAGGGEVIRLHEGSAPSWSPDGARLAFACATGICTMNADGSEVQQITTPPKGAFDETPDWGPDDQILFTRTYLDQPGRSRDIFVTPFPGKTEKRIGHAEPDDSAATWSPDGTRIAFIRGVGEGLEAPTGGFQLFVANADGGEIQQLTTDGAARPDWAPDGTTILYDEASALWTIPVEGGEPTKLMPATTGRGLDLGAFAGWAPEGNKITYTCDDPMDDHDICTMNLDGTGKEVVIDTPDNESDPAWQPRVEPDCGQIDVGSDDYGLELTRTEATAGTTIGVAGTTLRGEDGRWAPAGRIEMWWNTEVPDGQPIDEGPVVELLEVTEMEACTWESRFEVPDVPPGDYEITTFAFDDNGYGVFGTDEFRVEGGNSEEETNYAWPDAFVPSTTSQGDMDVMTAVFMDRTVARLAYPAELGLAQMGVQTTISYSFDEDREEAGAPFDVVAVHGEIPVDLLGEELERFEASQTDQATLHEVTGKGSLRGLRGDPPYALLFSRSEWNFIATLPSREDAPTVAENLNLSVTQEGWPSVFVTGPLQLSHGFGEARGPHLEFNDEDPRWDFHTRDTYVVMGVVSGCGPAEDGVSGSGGNAYAAKCLAFGGGEVGIFVSMYGPEQFVRDLYEGLRLK